jgi:sulfur carrier protein
MTITLRTNGKQVRLQEATSLLDYIRTLGVEPRAIAVELNGTILDRERYGDHMLADGDVLEIVRMVGGG